MSYKSRIPRITIELEGHLEAAVKAAAALVAARARDRVPVNTGRLRDAIHVEEGASEATVVAGDTEAFYGHIVEHGGAHTPPHPFMVPAAEESRGEIAELGKRALRGL